MIQRAELEKSIQGAERQLGLWNQAQSEVAGFTDPSARTYDSVILQPAIANCTATLAHLKSLLEQSQG